LVIGATKAIAIALLGLAVGAGGSSSTSLAEEPRSAEAAQARAATTAVPQAAESGTRTAQDSNAEAVGRIEQRLVDLKENLDKFESRWEEQGKEIRSQIENRLQWTIGLMALLVGGIFTYGMKIQGKMAAVREIFEQFDKLGNRFNELIERDAELRRAVLGLEAKMENLVFIGEGLNDIRRALNEIRERLFDLRTKF
jgi:DNA repair exonuclease SbcCD ATPase subunit